MKNFAAVSSLLLCATLADCAPLELGAQQKISGGSFKITSFSAPALADFNGDGLVDLALGGGGTAGIYFNRGNKHTPRFLELDVPFPSVDGSLRAIDFNRDGLLDLMIRNRIFLNFGTKMQPAFDTDWQAAKHFIELRCGDLPENYTFHYRAELRDLNGDERDDLILAVFKTKPLVEDYSGRFVVALDEGRGQEGVFGVPRWISILTTKEGKPVEYSDHGSCMIFRDLDGNGRQEALLGTYGGTIHTLVPKGELAWSKPEESIWKPKQQFAFPDCADLNGDGLPDLVVGGYNGYVYLGWNKGPRGSLAFADPEFLRGGEFRLNGYGMFDFADWDGDGSPDLLVGQGLTYLHIGGVQIFKNVGSPREPEFQFDHSVMADESLVLAVEGYLYSAPQLADIDGDGDQDLLVCAAPPEAASGHMYAFFNRGGSPPKLFAQAPMESGPYALKTGDGQPISVERGFNARWVDLDGDSRCDIVAGGTNVIFYRNVGRGRRPEFGEGIPLTSTESGNLSGLVAVGDLNGDAQPDLITSQPNDGTLQFFANLGEIGFAKPEPIHGAGQRISYREGLFPLICDFNGDGKNDLILGLLRSNRLYWFQGK